MSKYINEEVDAPTVELDEPTPASNGSLASRMAAASAHAEEQRTEIFPIPGPWQEVIAVELRLLGYKTMRNIGERHTKMRDVPLQELYVAADTLLAATTGFHEISDDGSYRPADVRDWVTLARMARTDLSDDLTPRQALFALVKDDFRVPLFYADWLEWARANRREVDDEVVRDFEMTG